MTIRPQFRDLTDRECSEIISRHHVGRLAFNVEGHVDIEPIGYVYDGVTLVMRTSPGSKLEALAHRPWVALEVDEVEGPFDWRSVVAHGTVYELSAHRGAEDERQAYRDAVERLRAAMPGSFTEQDPVPFRSIVLRLHVDRMTGKEAATR